MAVDINVMIGGEAGQGIQSLGELLARTCHKAGLWVLVMNDFESRIRGGHNFVQLRISDQPVHGPGAVLHLLVGMDEHTLELHHEKLVEGGLAVGPNDSLEASFEQVPIDFDELSKKAGGRRYANTIAVGACLGFLGAPKEICETTLKDQFSRVFGTMTEEILEKNMRAAKIGFSAAADVHLKHALDWAPGSPRGCLISGAKALALGALAGDCRFSAFYPMSPATAVIQNLVQMAPGVPLVVEQAEDEIAAVNMVVGASFAGVRAMTATSGGGFSLMTEGLGLAAITETPIVMVNAQRPGPATGLPTRTAQADLQFMIHASQDEFPRFVLAPGTPHQAYETMARAFELADCFQVPVIVLVDQFFNDSFFTAEEIFEAPQKVRHYVVSDEDMQNPAAYRRFALNESGISPRALPCRGKARVMACSDEHDEAGHISEDAEMRTAMTIKRHRKLKAMQEQIRPPEIIESDCRLRLVGWGSTRGALLEAVNGLRAEGLDCGGLHFTDIWPFPHTTVDEILRHSERFLMVEQNHTAQLGQVIRQQTGHRFAGSVLKDDGRPICAAEIIKAVKDQIGG